MPERAFFVHMQKTGGTALWRRLGCQFGARARYPGPDDGPPPRSVLDVQHLLSCWSVRRQEIRVITGHFPLCTVELLDAPFATFTLLRDPVERTLSALRDQHQRSPELAGAPLEVIYEDPSRAPLLRNHMVRMLALTTATMRDGALTPVTLGPRDLDRAVERLRDIDVLGFQEDFDAFCTALTQRFGWDLGPPVLMNRTTAVDVPAALRARIAADNTLDTQLYAAAREMCGEGASRRAT